VKTILATFLTVLLLLPVSAFGEIQTITHTVKQPFGGSQSPDDARISAVHKAKQEALEMAGTYIESLTVVKNSQVDKDEILALAAGVLKAEVVSQKNYVIGDAFGIDVVVKVVVDTSVLEERVKKLLQDRSHLEQLKQAEQRERELLQKVAGLEIENQRLMKKKQTSKELTKQFKDASRGLRAGDWYKKAVALWDTNDNKYADPERAIEYLNQAIRMRSDIAAGYMARGIAYGILGQHQRAIKDFNEVIRLEPDDALAYNNRGITYGKLGQYQRAIEDYNQAIRLEPDYAKAYGNRGVAYKNLGQYQRTIKDFNEVIRLEPDDALAYNNRGATYAYLGQYKNARADYDEAIRLKPDYGGAYYNYACSFSLQKDATRACNWLKLAIERGYKNWKHLETDKDFDNIRNEKCFVDIIKENVKPDEPLEGKAPQEDMLNTESTVDTPQQYKRIKAIVLTDGNTIEGQILSINAYSVKIRTKDGKILTYSFEREVQRFIEE